MREELLFDSALGFGVKVLDDEDALADLVELLDTPSAMVDIHELLEGITLMRIDQGGAQAKRAARDFIFEEPHSQRDDIEIGILPADVDSRSWRRVDGDLGVGLWAREELSNHGAAAFLQTENRVDGGFAVLMEQGVGEIAPVVDNDVVFLEKLQVAHGAQPLVGMRDEVEIKGQLRFQLVEAAEQSLRIVRIVAGSVVAASEQLSW